MAATLANTSKKTSVLWVLLILVGMYVLYKTMNIGSKLVKAYMLDSTATRLASQITYPPIKLSGQLGTGMDTTVIKIAATPVQQDLAHATPRSPGMHAGTVRLLAVGDTGSNKPEQRIIADAMEARCQQVGGVHGLLLLGDLVYPDGVASLDDPKWRTHIADYYRDSPCLTAAMIYPVIGNHDYNGKPSAWIHRARIDAMWYFPSRSWERQFDGLFTLYGIDTEIPWFGGVGALTALDTENEPDVQSWRIALGHHPIESASLRGGRHRGGGLAGRKVRDSLCQRVDLYLSGHAHHMEHRSLDDCDIEQVVVGTGGAGLQAVNESDPRGRFIAGQFGFCELTISPQHLEIRLFNRRGDKVYGYTKTSDRHTTMSTRH